MREQAYAGFVDDLRHCRGGALRTLKICENVTAEVGHLCHRAKNPQTLPGGKQPATDWNGVADWYDRTWETKEANFIAKLCCRGRFGS